MKILYFYITNSFEGFLSFNVHIKEFIQNANRIKGIELVGYRPVVSESEPQAEYLSLYGKIKNIIPRWTKDILAFFANFNEYRYGVSRIREEKPDAILFRYNFMNFYQILLQRKFKLPLVLEVNAPISDERKEHGDLFFYKWAFALEKWGWGEADKIHVVSNELKRILAKHVPEEKIFVAHNGVNPEEYEQAATRGVGKIRIGFVGSFGKYHGIDLLFEAIPILLDKYENLEFCLIGQGGLYEEYKDYFVKSRYSDRVILKGYIGRDEIPVELGKFDIATMFNFTEYGSPLKMFEYMMAGCAMVLPNRASIGEIAEDGKDVLLFEPRNIDSFVEALSQVIEDESMRKRLGDHAQRKVRDNYTWLHNAQRVTREIDSVTP